MTNLNIDHALTDPARPAFSWHVALVRLALVAAPIATLAALAHAL